MRQTIQDAIREATEESVVDSSLKISKFKIENTSPTHQTESSPKKNIHLSFRKENTINEDKQQVLTANRSCSIDVNGLKSLSNKSPQSKYFDQNFFYNDQKIPNKVQDEYSQLNIFLEVKLFKSFQLNNKLQKQDLNKKIAEIVVQNESDFLRIYKEQMREVYKELLRLKRRIEDEDFKLKTNTKILVLTQERNYFQKSALFLDEKCRLLEQENKELKFKSKILQDDLVNYQGILIAFLKQVISQFVYFIDCKKENKQLKGELLFLYENKSNLPSQMQDQLRQSEKQIKDFFQTPKSVNQKEQIFSITNIPQKNEIIPIVKRSSSHKQLGSTQSIPNYLPSTPLSSSSMNRKQQYQIFSEMEKKKSEIMTNSRIPNEQEKKEMQQPSQEVKILLQENQILKSHVDLLKKSNLMLKSDKQLSNKASYNTDLDKTRPESVKEAKKEQMYKKQLQKLQIVFKNHNKI